ncbi:MAG: response regulator, partial [Caulobacteraceae bacterium]|nr:response regulator [Caulobacteraceae bacterium]
VLASGQPLEVEESAPTAEGGWSHWHAYKFPFTDRQGRRFLGGVAIEISAQKRVQEQFRQAQKMEAIGRLAGGVAHDFNNLLMAMLGSLQILRKRIGDDPKAVRLLENAMTAADRGAALTQRLLSFARRQDLRPEAVDVPALVTGMKDLLARTLGPGVRLQHDIPGALPPILIDANQLELALLNLSVNARDAMPDGGVITLSADAISCPCEGAPAELAPGDYVRISVSDTGVGMSPEVLARSAEPFFTTKGIGKGTGLGLSMVHGLAAQSGGQMTLSSREGEGARVDIWIPQASTAPPSPARKATRSRAAQPGDRRTILVVDDDTLVAAGTVAMLEDLGHEVVEVHSAPEALRLLDSRADVDLVITDHAMPGMTGVELADRLRILHPGLAVVLATGYADLAKTAGVGLPRLTKPFMQDELGQVVSRHARTREGAAAARQLAG